MTISQTSGSVTPSLFGLTPGDNSSTEEPNHFAFGGVVHPQPSRFKSSPKNLFGYQVLFSSWLANSSGVTFGNQVTLDVNEGEVMSPVSTGDGSYGWLNHGATRETKINSLSLQGWDDPDTDVRSMKGYGQLIKTSTGAQGDSPMMALYMDNKNDNAPAYSALEPNGRHPETGTTAYDWSPQDANESCSAWVMKQQLGRNINKKIRETRGGWCLPLYDSQTIAI
jgi:hypothetical protein